MLLSRRLNPEAANHKLETLVRHLALDSEGTFHRALYDAEMAGRVWLATLERIAALTGLESVPFALAQSLCSATKPKVKALLQAAALSPQAPPA